MVDIVDTLEDFNDVALTNAKLKRPQYTGESLSECVRCGTEIPEGRRLAILGVRHCVDCAGVLERC